MGEQRNVGRQIGSTIEQARESGRELKQTASELGETARGRLGETFEDLRHRFDETRQVVVDRTREAARATNTYVNENPWIAVGISVGVGLLAGMMISRRSAPMQ
jgi:ElaB/YqjD/DUF883 family membrane-anchored ribosome-binding protein